MIGISNDIGKVAGTIDPALAGSLASHNEGQTSAWAVDSQSFLATYCKARDPLIHGLLRRGETANIIAAPKVGKTWGTLGLCSALTCGVDWLGFQTERSRVLLIDNELHPESLAERIRVVFGRTGGDVSRLYAKSLRGMKLDILQLAGQLKKTVERGHFDLIILDALYRMLPDGTSESDNAKMMHVYNTVDEIAFHTGAAVVLVHHTSKGEQAHKGVTDVGSGAGSISRAADTHIILRPHAIESCAVLEAVTRSFVSPHPQTIRFEYPLWHATQIEPELKQVKTQSEARQERLNSEANAAVLACVQQSRRRPSERAIRDATNFGLPRVRKAIKRLLDSKQIELKRVKCGETGKRKEVYAIPQF